VHASDGRTWALRRRIRWRYTATPVQFEHDLTQGGAPIVLGGLALFWCAVGYLWLGDHVHVPWYFGIAALLTVALIPLRWAVTRPWLLTAETTGPTEAWEGLVGGYVAAREEMFYTARNLRTRGRPDRVDGPLSLVAGDGTIIAWPTKPEE
jgi:hypothetical protein